jgi:hypothetical protein
MSSPEQQRRLVLFDLSDDTVPQYNPLRPNFLRLDVHARFVAGAIKSAWGSSLISDDVLAAVLQHISAQSYNIRDEQDEQGDYCDIDTLPREE